MKRLQILGISGTKSVPETILESQLDCLLGAVLFTEQQKQRQFARRVYKPLNRLYSGIFYR